METDIQVAWIAAGATLGAAVAGLIGVYVGARMTAGAEEKRIAKATARAAAHSAALMVGHLERFSLACLDVARDVGELHPPDRPNLPWTRHVRVERPAFDPMVVEGMDWKALPPAVVSFIINLPYRQGRADSLVDEAFEHEGDPYEWPETLRARRLQYARLGLEVQGVAHTLRELTSLPTGVEADEWSIQRALQEQMDFLRRE